MGSAKIQIQRCEQAVGASIAIVADPMRPPIRIATSISHTSESWALRNLELTLEATLDEVRAARKEADERELPELRRGHAEEIAAR